MALVTVPPLMFPTVQSGYGKAGGGFVQTLLIDASGEKAAVVFRVPKTGVISGVGFRLGTVTTGQTLKVSLQDVGEATAVPDETVDQSFTVAVADTDDDTWKQGDFGSTRTVTIGDYLACVIEFDSTVGNLSISAWDPGSGFNTGWTGQGYPCLKTAGAWGTYFLFPILAVKYSDGSYEQQIDLFPFTALTSVTINQDSTPDELGNRFTFPARVRVKGVAYFKQHLGGSGEVVLYDSDGGTVLRSVAFSNTGQASGATDANWRYFSSPVILEANTVYRLVYKSTADSPANGITVFVVSVNAAAIMDVLDGGQAVHRTERTNGGAWTQTATQRVFASLGVIIDQVDAGAGGGTPTLMGAISL